MEIRPAKQEEWESAMALAWRTFLHFEASDYTPQGVDSFLDFISDTTLNRMFIMGNYRLFVAVEKEPERPGGRMGKPSLHDSLKDGMNNGRNDGMGGGSNDGRNGGMSGGIIGGPGEAQPVNGKEKILGLISLREVNHISLLFVDEKYHKQGIGRALLNYAATYLYEEQGKIFCTVNAAPYAVEFYKKIGFHAVKPEESRDGIRFTPMIWYFNR